MTYSFLEIETMMQVPVSASRDYFRFSPRLSCLGGEAPEIAGDVEIRVGFFSFPSNKFVEEILKKIHFHTRRAETCDACRLLASNKRQTRLSMDGRATSSRLFLQYRLILEWKHVPIRTNASYRMFTISNSNFIRVSPRRNYRKIIVDHNFVSSSPLIE